MDKWTIRPACTGDFEAVVRMIAELMDYQGLEGETPVEAAVLERDVLQNGHPSVAVAEAAGELVGYVLYFPTYSSRYGRPCRYIEDVYVKAAHRGRGIGGAGLPACGVELSGRQRGGAALLPRARRRAAGRVDDVPPRALTEREGYGYSQALR